MTRLETLNALFENTELDFLDVEYLTDIDNEDELRETIEERISEQDIVYYARAMEYLSEHDNSLHDSLELAAEMGYYLQDLNSEILATLLYQKNLREELSDIDFSEVFDADE